MKNPIHTGEAASWDLDPEEILSHTSWLRRIAGALVRDDAAADDLVQDTLHVAATSKGPVRDVRAFMAGTLRRLASRGRRSDTRRARREATVAEEAEVAAPGSDELAARVETLRVVLEELRGLTPTQQRVVSLRYLEGLEPAEIAAQEGTSSSTVRSHLARGLAALRERLDARSGGRGTWCAILGPWAFPAPTILAGADGVPGTAADPVGTLNPTPRPGTPGLPGGVSAPTGLAGAVIGTGVLAMSLKAATLVLAPLALAAVWFTNQGEETGVDRSLARVEYAAAQLADVADSPVVAEPKLRGALSVADGTEVQSGAAAALSLLPGEEPVPQGNARIQGRAVDRYTGEPVPDASLNFVQSEPGPDGTRKSTSALTGADGRFREPFEWLPEGQVEIMAFEPTGGIMHPGQEPLIIDFPFTEDLPLSVGPTFDLDFPAGLVAPPEEFELCFREPGSDRDLDRRRVRTGGRTWVRFHHVIAELPGDGPWDIVAIHGGGLARGFAQVSRKRGIAPTPLVLEFEHLGSVVFHVDREGESELASLGLRVRPRVSGSVAQGAATNGLDPVIAWFGKHPNPAGTARTEGLPGGEYEWQLVDGTDGPWHPVTVRSGQETRVEVADAVELEIVDLHVRVDIAALPEASRHFFAHAFRESAPELGHRVTVGRNDGDPDGVLRIKLPGVQAGSWGVLLNIEPGMVASENPIFVRSGEPAPTMVLTLAANQVPLRLRIVDSETQVPIPGATGGYVRSMTDAREIARGQDGWSMPLGVEGGVPLTVTAGAPGYKNVVRRIVPSPEGADVVIELQRGWAERVLVVSLTTMEFVSGVSVLADGVLVGVTDGDGALWLPGSKTPATLELATEGTRMTVPYSSFDEAQPGDPAPFMGWVFGVTTEAR